LTTTVPSSASIALELDDVPYRRDQTASGARSRARTASTSS
jgi:hypothetical protein